MNKYLLPKMISRKSTNCVSSINKQESKLSGTLAYSSGSGDYRGDDSNNDNVGNNNNVSYSNGVGNSTPRQQRQQKQR
jgi:hypothetical protein